MRPPQANAEQQALGRRWVLGIVIGLSAVVIVNVIVAYVAGSSHAELERDDYYLASLKHQQVLDAVRRGAEQRYRLSYSMDHGLVLAQAGQPVTHPVAGTLRMERPDQASLDFSADLSFPLSLSDQAMLADRLQAGRWNAQLTFAAVEPTTTVSGTLYIGGPAHE